MGIANENLTKTIVIPMIYEFHVPCQVMDMAGQGNVKVKCAGKQVCYGDEQRYFFTDIYLHSL